jgi:hypothetical protein
VNVSVHDKRYFADVVNLTDLERNNYPGLSGWANLITGVLMENLPSCREPDSWFMMKG